jgi:cephalosporin-C deacetylase-like acetyl esterase
MRRLDRALATLLLLTGVTTVLAQDARRHSPQERYDLFRRHLANRGEAVTRHQFRGIGNLDEWKRNRERIRADFLDSLGLNPLPQRTPLNARVTGGFQREGYRVENVVFQSMPGLYVTGNLYLPAAAVPGSKTPTVLYVSGHSPGPAGAKVDYQRHGIWFAKNGLIALLLDTNEFGEIPGIHHGLHNLEMWYWLSLGYTPASVEVWNAIRALDYLESRPEVDASRIAMTGRSGGGAITWFTAAADERVKVASPVHGTWSAGPHVARDTVRHNCDCIYFWNHYQLDLPVVAALIAPRPLMIINATKDVAFPPHGYQPVVEQLRRVYGWYGAAGKVAEFEMDTGHDDLEPYRREANLWISRWLRDSAPAYDETGIQPEEHKVLTALDGYPPDARNEGIQKRFIRAHEFKTWDSREAWEKRRAALRDELKNKVFRSFSRSPVPFAAWKGPETVWTQRYTDSFNIEFTTEDGIRVHGQLFVPRSGRKSHPALIYVRDKGDLVYPVDYDNLLSAFADHVVLVLRPRAVDYPMDNFRIASTKMSAALLGTTLESMQLWDVLRSMDYLVEHEKLNLSAVSVYGRGKMGVVALYSAALDDRVTRVIVEDVPGSHWTGPPFLNVLRYTDLAEVAGMVAPREIVSLTRFPAEFDYTMKIFGLHGKAENLRIADSLGEALRVWEFSQR